MSNIKSVSPRTQLPQYQPGQEVNFDIYSENEALVPGTVFLTGRLQVDVPAVPDPAAGSAGVGGVPTDDVG